MRNCASNKRAAVITADDVMTSSGALLSVFIREPEFQGQTKDKLATLEAMRIVENAVRDHFDHWLTGHPAQADRLLELHHRPRRGAHPPAPGKGSGPQDRGAQAPAARQARRLLGEPEGRLRALHRGRRLGRRLRQAGAQPRDPGRAALARQDPQRGQRHEGQADRQPAARRSRSRRWAAAPARPTARKTCATTRSSS